MKKCESCGHEYKLDGPRHHPDCRYWIDKEEYQNCVFMVIDEKGPMTLREVADIMGMSHVGIKLIEDRVLEKIRKKTKNNEKYYINKDLLKD